MENLQENYKKAVQAGLELDIERDKLLDELESNKKDYTKQVEVFYLKCKSISMQDSVKHYLLNHYHVM